MVNGTRLFYEAAGNGPTMLMMHGGLGMDHTYLRVHDSLADRVRLAYYDHRGNGRSDRELVDNLQLATLHDDAAALLDHLGVGRAVIYGHSYGAWIALGFALRYPERTAALVMCGGAAAFDYGGSIMADAQQRDPALAPKLVELFTKPPPTDSAFGELWLEILPLYLHRYEAMHRAAFDRTRYSVAANIAGGAQLATLNMVDQLGSLKCPTLLVVGDDDFITPSAQSYRVASRVPDAEVAELPSCGHFPFLETPTAYLAALRSWLERRVVDQA
jgi:proline iminopeptidase